MFGGEDNAEQSTSKGIINGPVVQEQPTASDIHDMAKTLEKSEGLEKVQ